MFTLQGGKLRRFRRPEGTRMNAPAFAGPKGHPAQCLHRRSIGGTLHSVKLIAQLKLLPTPEQANALKRTLQAANDACNYISAVAWETYAFGKFPLQKLLYQELRTTFKLGAQLAVRCIAKVANAYKLDRKTQRAFRPTAAVAFDDRNLSWNLKGSEVSIWTLDGRQAISFVCGERQRHLLETRSGETDLCLVGGQFYLFAACDVDEPDPLDVDGTLG